MLRTTRSQIGGLALRALAERDLPRPTGRRLSEISCVSQRSLPVDVVAVFHLSAQFNTAEASPGLLQGGVDPALHALSIRESIPPVGVPRGRS